MKPEENWNEKKGSCWFEKSTSFISTREPDDAAVDLSTPWAFWSREKVLHNSSTNEMRDHSTEVISPLSLLPVQMESGGTVLSTNWKDVGKRKVEMSPPEDVEFKKFWAPPSLSLFLSLSLCLTSSFFTFVHLKSSRSPRLSTASAAVHILLLPTPQCCCCSGLLTKCREPLRSHSWPTLCYNIGPDGVSLFE